MTQSVDNKNDETRFHNIKPLPHAKGFPMNLRPSRPDTWGKEALVSVYGSKRVDGIMNSLHRSTMDYDLMHDDLLKYNRKHVYRIEHDSYLLALESVRQDLRKKAKIIPYTMGAVPALPDFPGAKSPGLPYKNQGFVSKRECIDGGKLREINRDWQNISRRKMVHLPDVCLFARAQIAREGKEKIRATWGYPLSVYCEEGRFFYPFLDFIKSRDHTLPIAYGIEMAHGGMEYINTLLQRYPNAKYVCTDWKSFDKTIPPWLIRDAFSIIAELFDFGHVLDVEGLIWDVDPILSMRRWKRMVDYFVQTPVRTCKGDRYLVTGGIPSGSCWTNIIDSIINIIVTRWIVYETTGCFPADEIYLGDDAVLIIASGKVSLSDMADLAEVNFGMNLSVEKSYVTTNTNNVHFLGYFNLGGYPFKNQDFLIASFIHPEHTRKTGVEACAAAVGQLWSGFDPLAAYCWYKVILYIADLDQVALSDVVAHIRLNSHRHKYLAHVGIDVKTITLPEPVNCKILEVLPKPCRFVPPIRNWSYRLMWSEILEDEFYSFHP
nr:MAG: RNA-dependent RNA polymerase [Partitiviridae sp.]